VFQACFLSPLPSELHTGHGVDVSGQPLVGASPRFVGMLGQLRRVAASDAPVLVEGETGCGKELAARAVHAWGARSSGPFVPVNCGALPDHLLEAELFGHERGAFTDAKAARRGLVAEADGGTLFLDEVDALSAKAQVVLLRFAQDQRYRPLGSARELRTDVRLVTATNRPLDAAVEAGDFRADLMYRLKILQVRLPALRERPGDAVLLARHFLEAFCAKYGLPGRRFDEATLDWLHRQPWPGNVRELENWVHRELLMADGNTVGHASQPSQPLHGADSMRWRTQDQANFQDAKAEAVRSFERDYVVNVLRQSGGNVTQAARIAGKERRAFGKLLKKYGIDRRGVAEAN
jgi:two-component system response regulator GlrR